MNNFDPVNESFPNQNKLPNFSNQIDFFKENKIKQLTSMINELTIILKENRAQQNLLNNHYNDLANREICIENTLDKIKILMKTKHKKQGKYLNFIPLSKVYFFCAKKNPFYYMLLDIIISCRKKTKQKCLTKNNNKIKNDQESELEGDMDDDQADMKSIKSNNRFKFKKNEDGKLNSLLKYESTDINWENIANKLNRVPLQVFVRYLETSNFYNYKKWTFLEDTILKKSIIYYGPKNWQQISYCLDGRNNSQCFHRWMKGINPKIVRSKWTFEEDLILGLALKIYGNKKWSKIANHLTGRTDIQCRERYCNILDPSLEDVEWKQKDDNKLLEFYKRYGGKWSKIAREFGNRTDNTCWRRWKLIHSNKSDETSKDVRGDITENTDLLIRPFKRCELEELFDETEKDKIEFEDQIDQIDQIDQSKSTIKPIRYNKNSNSESTTSSIDEIQNNKKKDFDFHSSSLTLSDKSGRKTKKSLKKKELEKMNLQTNIFRIYR